MTTRRTTTANRPVRVEDVARVAGVSPITVSRALSRPEKVREETRQLVADAVAKTGYIVNTLASTLRSGRSSIITIFVSSLLNPHFASGMQGLVDAFEGSPYHLMFAQAGYAEVEDADVVGSVLPFRPAAVLFNGIVRSEATRNSLKQLGVPVVEMWGYRPDPIDMLVGVSDHHGGTMIGDHLGQQGFRRIGYAGRIRHTAAERLEGLRQGLARHGAEIVHVFPVEGAQQIGDGMMAFDAIREAAPDVDAIFFGTDVLASGGILRAGQMGIRVPQEIAIAGYGDLDFSSHMRPPLTTVHIASYEMAREAGWMLLRRLAGQEVANPVLLYPIELMPRRSTCDG